MNVILSFLLLDGTSKPVTKEEPLHRTEFSKCLRSMLALLWALWNLQPKQELKQPESEESGAGAAAGALKFSEEFCQGIFAMDNRF